MTACRAEWMLASVAALATTQCGPPPGAQVRADVQTMNREQTPDKLFERGKAFASIGDLTRAEQYLAAAVDAGGDPKVIVPMLLRVCVEARRYRAAIDYGENQLKKHPQDLKLRVLLGNLYAAVDEPLHAREQFELVLAQRPDDAEVHYVLAVLLRDTLDDIVQADRHFREYLRINPKGPHADEARGSLLKSVP
ncbi:MAG: tetratricopeptide repeat protein [Deltaproteobacteria bacterium]|nr:tetratricopeptide repeat protein [Deltaproteobacteria bacterium]